MYVGYTLASGHCSVWDTITSLTALTFISTPTDALKRTTGGNCRDEDISGTDHRSGS